MEGFSFSGTPHIIFGEGSFSKLPERIRSFGKTVLIVTGGSSFKESGREDLLRETLLQNKTTAYFYSVTGEPSPDDVDQAAREYRKKPVNVVVGIGGGSALDAGKAIAAMLACEGSVKDYLEGIGSKKTSGDTAPYIAVPTTAGTGSEATKNAVLSVVGDSGYKKSLRHDEFVPDIALIDPALALNCPSKVTASCGMDAISQLIEAYTSTKSNPLTDALALSGLKSAADCYPAVCFAQGSDVAYRGKMAYASLMSGIALAHAGLGTVHGIAGPIGGLTKMPHGAACGTLLAVVMRHMVTRLVEEGNLLALKKCAEIGRTFAGTFDKNDQYYAETMVGILEDWTVKVSMPRLGEYGITETTIDAIVKESDNKNSPVPFTSDEMSNILKERL